MKINHASTIDKKFWKSLNKADHCSQEEAHLDEALLDDLLGLEEEELDTILQKSSTNETSLPNQSDEQAPKSQENDLFSDLVTQNYPNITHEQKIEIAHGINKAISGLFDFVKQTKNEEVTGEITAEVVKEYFEKLKQQQKDDFKKK